MQQPLMFQKAIAQSAEWIGLWDAEELSDEVLADYVGQMVKQRDGARGFFVAALTGDSPLMDRLPEALVQQLRLAGSDVVDLTVRNLAMSSAMALHHTRNCDQERKESSLRVQTRCIDLLRHLDSQMVKESLESLRAALSSEGEYHEFLVRWGYDEEQYQAIGQAINLVAE